MKYALRQARLPLGYPVLYIDFHGTISSSRFWTNLRDPSLSKKLEHFIFHQRGDLLDDWMTGRISSKRIHEIIACEFTDNDTSLLWTRFESQSRRMSIKGLHLLADLRKYFLIALTTTNVDSFSTITYHSRSLFKYFDCLINSADIGVTKNNAATFFEEAARITGTPISQSILIDDSPLVCGAFHALGGHSIRVNTVKGALALLLKLQDIVSARGVSGIAPRVDIAELMINLGRDSAVGEVFRCHSCPLGPTDSFG